MKGDPFSNLDRTGHARIGYNKRKMAYDHLAYPSPVFQGGGNVSALRAYQAFHPDAAIYTVTYRGRTVWMTSKQQAIWHAVQKYWRRGTRDTLARIAAEAHCSRATVSRFLRRLDLWRFIDLATMRGRGGGTYVFTRTWEETRKWTMSARARVRLLLAQRIRRQQLESIQPALDAARKALRPIPLPQWWTRASQPSIWIGSTDATLPLTK